MWSAGSPCSSRRWRDSCRHSSSVNGSFIDVHALGVSLSEGIADIVGDLKARIEQSGEQLAPDFVTKLGSVSVSICAFDPVPVTQPSSCGV